MSEPSSAPSFFARLALAFAAFFRILFDAVFASRVQRVAAGEPQLPAQIEPSEPAAPEARPAAPEAAALREAPTDSALQLLGLMQREGRLIDFLQEDIASYSDADIGAAARVVHDSVKRALDEHLVMERIRAEAEGSAIRIEAGFAASELRLVGNVVGQPPFEGRLTHTGWRVTQITLPQVASGHDLHVLQPAEVEL